MNGRYDDNMNTYFLASTVNVQPASYPFTDYVPFPNTDMSAGLFLGATHQDPGCNSVCNITPSCVGFVTTSTGICYLKSANSNPVENSDMTAYYQVKPVRQYFLYNSLDFVQPHIIFFRGDRNQCRQACDALPGCVGYVIIHL